MPVMTRKEEIEVLEGGNYMSLATRRKSGEFVNTPVWFAPDGDSYYVFSAGNAGKVKRLRNFSEARVAACTISGALTGDWIDASAEVLSSERDCAAALAALRRKYGLQMCVADAFSKLSGKMARRAYIRVTPRRGE
jgi:PPOX class probable F420-dependent enzyme